MGAPAVKVFSQMEQVKLAYTTAHPMFGIFAEVLEEVGGKTFIKEYAEDNPGQFIRVLVAMAPSVAPVTGMQGDVNIHIHNQLGRTALDGDFKDVTDG